MEIYNHLIKSEEDVFKYFNENNICFLDIETTGLSRKYHQIYLIGLVYFNIECNSWCLTQLFADDLDEEKKLLKEFNDFISTFDLLITYNGESFDIPFIKHRFKNYGIDSKMININSLDIYREIKKNKSYLQLENLKLKSIEESLGIYREDIYSGKDCIDFYYKYVNTKEESLKQNILKHNYDDLYYLLPIVKIFDLIKDIKSITMDLNSHMIDIEIEDIRIDGDILKISSNTSKIDENINIIYYENSFNFCWKNKTNLYLDLEINEGFITPTKKCLFINKGNFPFNTDLKDLSQFMVPDNIVLLKVEDKYEVENIKNVIKDLVFYVINQ